MPVLKNIAALTTGIESSNQNDVLTIADAALVWRDEKIIWRGAQRDLPDQFSGETVFDAQRALVLPGLIDCHTHLAFGGWRTEEFVQRCLGKSYQEIAQAGGGILSTVKQTRAISKTALEERCLNFLSQMAALGITTVEVKSGYGLDVENEIKLLEVYAGLQKRSALTIVSTLLAGHAVPTDYKTRRADYIRLLVDELIPQVASRNLALFCDVFVDPVAFSNQEAREILNAGKQFGLRPKLHVDQLSNGGGAELAAELDAISADHLEYISDVGIAALKDKGVVAVALPLATLFTKQVPLNARRLLDKGVKVALATDFNPGSAPSFNLPLAMLLGCTMNSMTPAEAFNGVTLVAAKALGIEKTHGSLDLGKYADFALFSAPSVDDWLYHFTANSCTATIKRGTCIAGTL